MPDDTTRRRDGLHEIMQGLLLVLGGVIPASLGCASGFGKYGVPRADKEGQRRLALWGYKCYMCVRNVAGPHRILYLSESESRSK